MFPAAILTACSSDDAADVPGATGCVDGCELELSDPVTCAGPGRELQHFVRTESAQGARLPGANLASAGVVAADFTGDGAIDLFFAHENGVDSQFFVNDGGDEAVARFGGVDLEGAVGGSAADADGDGDLDLLVTRWERSNVLLRNDGAGYFTDVTVEAGLLDYVHHVPGVELADDPSRASMGYRHQSSSWADLDLDGDLDLYVGNYDEKPEDQLYNDPDLPPADPDELWINNGDGTFTDRADLVPDEIHDGYTFMSSWFDTTGDAYPELFVWNDFGTSYPSQVLHNDEGQGFSYVPGQSGLDNAFEAMGVAVADLNGDRLPDFAVTSYKKVMLAQSSTTLRTYAGPLWIDHALGTLAVTVPKPASQIYGWGAEFGDLDHDRDDDLVMLFGFWSMFDGGEDKRAQYDGLWLQGADGAFTDVATDPAWEAYDPLVTRGLVVADLDGNGFLDLAKRSLGNVRTGRGPEGIKYLATCDDTAWLVVRLRQADRNPDAIGARVTVTSPDGHEQTRWITAGSTSMYSSGPPEAHFGLAQDETVDVEVTWPDGATATALEVPTRRRATLIRR